MGAESSRRSQSPTKHDEDETEFCYGAEAQVAAAELEKEKRELIGLARLAEGELSTLERRELPKELWRALASASPEVLQDPGVALAAVSLDGMLLAHFGEDLRGNFEIVSAAVAQRGAAFEFASEGLRSDRTAVLAMVKKKGRALQWASPDLRADPAIVLKATEKNWRALQYASEGLRGDKVFASEAIKLNWRSIRCLGPELLADRDIGLQAVSQDGLALEALGENLRDDKEVVQAAMQETRHAVGLASAALREDKAFMLQSVTKHPDTFRHAGPHLRSDKEFLLAAVSQRQASVGLFMQDHPLHYTTQVLQSDKEVVLEAARHDRRALHYASDALRGDKDFALLAARCHLYDEAAQDSYNQATAALHESLSLIDFLDAFQTAIGVPGQDAPVLWVSLAKDSSKGAGDFYSCEVRLLSGKTFVLSIPNRRNLWFAAFRRSWLNVNDLAVILATEVSKYLEVPTKQVFLVFDDQAGGPGSGDSEPFSVWDWNRPLSELSRTMEQIEALHCGRDPTWNYKDGAELSVHRSRGLRALGRSVK